MHGHPCSCCWLPKDGSFQLKLRLLEFHFFFLVSPPFRRVLKPRLASLCFSLRILNLFRNSLQSAFRKVTGETTDFSLWSTPSSWLRDHTVIEGEIMGRRILDHGSAFSFAASAASFFALEGCRWLWHTGQHTHSERRRGRQPASGASPTQCLPLSGGLPAASGGSILLQFIDPHLDLFSSCRRLPFLRSLRYHVGRCRCCSLTCCFLCGRLLRRDGADTSKGISSQAEQKDCRYYCSPVK